MDAENQQKTVGGISILMADTTAYRLPDEVRFRQYQQQLFQGGKVNQSEQHAATHTQFREEAPNAQVSPSLAQIRTLSEAIRGNQFTFQVTDVVNIGIGGSDLGPKLICEAFLEEENGPEIHFVSNLDIAQIQSLLKKLNPQHTLFLITSKSFRTLETLENKAIAEKWLRDHQVDPRERLIAITNSEINARKQGISETLILTIPESVGGRFSIWSAVGLSCAIALGYDKFYALHVGAREMDQHFLTASVENNLPIQYALQLSHAIHRDQVRAIAILPYAHRLRTLPAYLQQLMMESLGKCVSTLGIPVKHPTGPIVYGSAGTSSQHSLQQMMMQGTHPIFADFILPLSQNIGSETAQVKMIANCLTQVKTLREGVAHSEAIKRIPGNKHVNLFVLGSLNLKTVGALLAFYEHVVATLGFLLDINPFDQWGVEHAKRACEQLTLQFNGKMPTLIEIEALLSQEVTC